MSGFFEGLKEVAKTTGKFIIELNDAYHEQVRDEQQRHIEQLMQESLADALVIIEKVVPKKNLVEFMYFQMILKEMSSDNVKADALLARAIEVREERAESLAESAA